jgi:hypothetical protein
MPDATNESNKSTDTEVEQPESIMALANRTGAAMDSAGAAMVAAVALMEEAKALEKKAHALEKEAKALEKDAQALEKDLEMRLRGRKLPWKKIPQLSRAGVLPFLSIKDNAEFSIALLNDEECRPDYLLSHENKEGLPAYDNWVYTNTDNFQGLRWVMKRGIKLNTLQIRVLDDWGGEETDRDQVLHSLVWNEHDDIAREYVRINSDVEDFTVEDGLETLATTLLCASEHGYMEVVDALIATGADVNKTDNCGYTPVSRASSHNGRLEVVQALIAAGADVNKADKWGVTPIYWASDSSRLEVVQALIAAGADVNKGNMDGNTPIYWASSRGDHEIVQALLAAGATYDEADYQRQYGTIPLS